MNNKLITASENSNFDLFKVYLDTAKSLKEDMQQLFNTGIDTNKSICSIQVSNKERFSYVFKQETIDSIELFLDKLLDLTEFSDCKLFQEFLFEDSERYSLCSCYQGFVTLNDIEIFHAETLAMEEL